MDKEFTDQINPNLDVDMTPTMDSHKKDTMHYYGIDAEKVHVVYSYTEMIGIYCTGIKEIFRKYFNHG